MGRAGILLHQGSERLGGSFLRTIFFLSFADNGECLYELLFLFQRFAQCQLLLLPLTERLDRDQHEIIRAVPGKVERYGGVLYVTHNDESIRNISAFVKRMSLTSTLRSLTDGTLTMKKQKSVRLGNQCGIALTLLSLIRERIKERVYQYDCHPRDQPRLASLGGKRGSRNDSHNPSLFVHTGQKK